MYNDPLARFRPAAISAYQLQPMLRKRHKAVAGLPKLREALRKIVLRLRGIFLPPML
jgi:hypothetical protein